MSRLQGTGGIQDSTRYMLQVCTLLSLQVSSACLMCCMLLHRCGGQPRREGTAKRRIVYVAYWPANAPGEVRPPKICTGHAAACCRAFAGAVLCGYRLPTGEAKLNPADTEVPPLGSQLVFLGRGGAAHLIASPESPLYDSAAKSAADRMKKERTYKSKVRCTAMALHSRQRAV